MISLKQFGFTLFGREHPFELTMASCTVPERLMEQLAYRTWKEKRKIHS